MSGPKRMACHRMDGYCTQVVSPPPTFPSNRTLFIAITLQLPMSLKVAERTSPRGTWSPKQNFVRNPTAKAAQKKEIRRRIRERRKKPAENPGCISDLLFESRATGCRARLRMIGFDFGDRVSDNTQ